MILWKLQGFCRLCNRSSSRRTWATATIAVMVTMVMQTAVEHVSSALWVRMMRVAVAATVTMVVTMIMFFTITESLGYPRGNVHSGNNRWVFSSAAPPRVYMYSGTVPWDLCWAHHRTTVSNYANCAETKEIQTRMLFQKNNLSSEMWW